jgi:hypothetical protein
VGVSLHGDRELSLFVFNLLNIFGDNECLEGTMEQVSSLMIDAGADLDCSGGLELDIELDRERGEGVFDNEGVLFGRCKASV